MHDERQQSRYVETVDGTRYQVDAPFLWDDKRLREAFKALEGKSIKTLRERGYMPIGDGVRRNALKSITLR